MEKPRIRQKRRVYIQHESKERKYSGVIFMVFVGAVGLV